MEDKAFYKQLVDRYVAKSLTNEELEVFAELVKQGKLDEELAMAMERAELLEETVIAPAIHRLWPRLAGVAAAITLIGLAGWFFYSSNNAVQDADQNKYAKTDIAPGHNGATLTLANGRIIKLSNAKNAVAIGATTFRYDDGSAVALNDATTSELGNTEITAATGRAQTYAVTLPDGTRVWLNAATKLTFPTKFSTNARMVSLDGEAYFEVYKDKAHPFVVKSQGHHGIPQQEITVLGTHFNISAYNNDDQVKTALLEGSVKVDVSDNAYGNASTGQTGIILKVNQQSVVAKSAKIAVENINAQEAVDWKNGTFVFEHQKLSEIMKKVERWYDVSITYQNSTLKNQTFTGEISRYDHVSELLKILEGTGKVSFEIENRNIIVSK